MWIPPIRIPSSRVAFYKNDIVRQVVRMRHKTVNVVSLMFHHIDQMFSSLCIVYVLHGQGLKRTYMSRDHRAAEIITFPLPEKTRDAACDPALVVQTDKWRFGMDRGKGRTFMSTSLNGIVSSTSISLPSMSRLK